MQYKETISEKEELGAEILNNTEDIELSEQEEYEIATLELIEPGPAERGNEDEAFESFLQRAKQKRQRGKND